RTQVLVLISAALVCAAVLSLTTGSNQLPLDQLWDGLRARDDTEASIIIWSLRLPRTVVGVLVGAAFGVAGALIQALTRNPLADPGILGVNAGAAFAVTLGAGIVGVSGIGGYVWFAFLGAAVTTVLVYVIGSAGGGRASPVALALAGGGGGAPCLARRAGTGGGSPRRGTGRLRHVPHPDRPGHVRVGPQLEPRLDRPGGPGRHADRGAVHHRRTRDRARAHRHAQRPRSG